MKNRILLFGLMYLWMIPVLISQNNLPQGLTIKQNGSNFYFNFSIPSYVFDTATIKKADGTNEKFLDFVVNEEFGSIDSIGLPKLPTLTFMFAIPYDSKIPNLVLHDIQKDEIFLSHKILPVQEPISTNPNDLIPEFTINNDYYQSTGVNNIVTEITDDFIVAGVKGIRITITPFAYNPIQNKITIRKNINFEIQLPGLVSKKSASSSILDSYFNSLFVNNVPSSKSITKGNYLIITAPEYESTITYFANYKRNIGYNVTVASTNITGTTKESIKSYIQARYDNTSTRPVFVLLVGDVDKIPCWVGEHRIEPRTDLYYATLEGKDMVQDVFIGRFSVRTSSWFTDIQQLQNICNKTIFMETNIKNLSKTAVFLADDEYHSYTEGGHDKVVKDAFEPKGYSCLKLYANDGATHNEAISALNNNQIFMVYSGHGSSSSISGFSISTSDIRSLTNTVFPLGFSFACLTNKFEENECFGESWIRDNNGGIAYYGASQTTYYDPDKELEKKIFKNAWYEDDKEQLGCMVQLAMEKLSTGRDKRYREMYNLLGDPSFITSGISCMYDYVFSNSEVFHSGEAITYQASNTIVTAEGDATFTVQNGANVTLIAGNKIVLKPGTKIESGSRFHASIAQCNNHDSNPMVKKGGSFENENQENTLNLIEKDIHNNNLSIYPNPFSIQTSIEYNLFDKTDVIIEVFDLLGKKYLEEKKLEEGKGFHNYTISGEGLSQGIYIIKVTTSQFKEVAFIYKNE